MQRKGPKEYTHHHSNPGQVSKEIWEAMGADLDSDTKPPYSELDAFRKRNGKSGKTIGTIGVHIDDLKKRMWDLNPEAQLIAKEEEEEEEEIILETRNTVHTTYDDENYPEEEDSEEEFTPSQKSANIITRRRLGKRRRRTWNAKEFTTRIVI